MSRTLLVICAPTKHAARRYAKRHGLRRKDWVHLTTAARILTAPRLDHVVLRGCHDWPSTRRLLRVVHRYRQWVNTRSNINT